MVGNWNITACAPNQFTKLIVSLSVGDTQKPVSDKDST